MQREIDDLTAQQEAALQEARAATDAAARVAEEVRQERERLTQAALEERAERAELEALAPALEAEIRSAHLAIGQALHDELEAERVQVAERIAAAEAQLAAERAALDALRARALEHLRDHPETLNAAAGTELVPLPPIPGMDVLRQFVPPPYPNAVKFLTTVIGSES